MACDLNLHTRKFTRRAEETDRAARLETLENVDIRWLWAAPYESNDWRRAWNWLTFRQSALRHVRELGHRPDVVIGSSPQLFAASAARTIARRMRVPFVFEVRDLWPESLLAAGGKRGPGYRFLDRMASGLYRDAGRILVLAQGVGQYLTERGVAAEKIVHVPNGVDVETILPRACLGTEPDESRPLRLIYAGAHGPANGLECVLTAAELLRDQPGLHFVLVGDGPSKAQLQKQAASRQLLNVEFLATVSKHALVSLLHEADAGLMILKDAPLFSFGVSPNKLFDYLAAGIPVICNVPGEVDAMLGRSGAGIQTRDTSGRALADAVRQLVALGAAGRGHKGRLGRAWVEREHSRQVLGQRLDQALRDLIR